MKNCTCNKLSCNDTCLCACHREKTELEKDLIKFDEGLKELVPEIFPESVEPNNRVGRIEDTIDLGIQRMQKYDLKVFIKKTRSCNICSNEIGNNILQLCDKCLLSQKSN